MVGGVLAAVGLGVTGAYLGTPLSFVAMSVYCAVRLQPARSSRAERQTRAASPRPVDSRAAAWAPIAGLTIIAVLQNIDIIAAKHRFSTNLASSYSATAVAAKVLIWVAMGAGFYLVPEVSRRRSDGEDSRPVLAKALGIVASARSRCLLIYAFASAPAAQSSRSARSACWRPTRCSSSGSRSRCSPATYLAVQYMLALKRTWFLLAARRWSRSPSRSCCSRRRSEPVGFAAVVLGGPDRGRADRVRDRAAARQAAGADRADQPCARPRGARARRRLGPRRNVPSSLTRSDQRARDARPAVSARPPRRAGLQLQAACAGSARPRPATRRARPGRRRSPGPARTSAAARAARAPAAPGSGGSRARSVSSVDGVYSAAAGW